MGNRPVTTLEAAVELIDWYRCHWEIETLFHVLTNGCRVEALQLESQAKLELVLALYLVGLGASPICCVLGASIPRSRPICSLPRSNGRDLRPQQEETVQTATHSARSSAPDAQLGGFLARKGDGEPGVKRSGWACPTCATSPLPSSI